MATGRGSGERPVAHHRRIERPVASCEPRTPGWSVRGQGRKGRGDARSPSRGIRSRSRIAGVEGGRGQNGLGDRHRCARSNRRMTFVEQACGAGVLDARLQLESRGTSLLGVSSPKLMEGFTMSDRLNAEGRHQNQAHHHTQRGRSEAAEGDSGNAQQADGDEPLPRRMASEEARHN